MGRSFVLQRPYVLSTGRSTFSVRVLVKKEKTEVLPTTKRTTQPPPRNVERGKNGARQLLKA